MKKAIIGGFNIELFDDISELPMERFHVYNRMLLIDAGIGSDLADFDTHIEKAKVYMVKNPELAMIELDNMRQNVYFIQSGISPKHLAFCVLVKSIDGEEKNDLSLDGLQKILNVFAKVPNNEMTAQLEAVKKKIDELLQLYFPNYFDDSSIKEYYDDLKRRTMLMLKNVIDGEVEERNDQIDKITNQLIMYSKPSNFNGTESVEIQHDKNFENMCLMLSQHIHVDPKKYTVLQFYNASEYLKDIFKTSKTSKK